MSKQRCISAENAIANILNFVENSDDDDDNSDGDLAELNGESGIHYIFIYINIIYSCIYIYSKKSLLQIYVYTQEFLFP